MPAESPEDRLLSLIKGKYKKKDMKLDEPRPGSKDTLLSDMSKKMFVENKALRPIFSDSVNRILVIVLILLTRYLGYSILFPVHRRVDLYLENAGISTEAMDIVKRSSEPLRSETQSYAQYSKAIKGKRLFSAPFIEEEEAEKDEPGIDIASRFNLVGIIAGDDPQAIIEDKQDKKTHYLLQGQVINEVSVVSISEGKVVLGYKGKEIMLVL